MKALSQETYDDIEKEIFLLKEMSFEYDSSKSIFEHDFPLFSEYPSIQFACESALIDFSIKKNQL